MIITSAFLLACKDCSTTGKGAQVVCHAAGFLFPDDAVEELSRMQEAENARREQDKLAGKTDEVKITKRQFRAG